jgi:glucose/arabinose dehydrogenase
MAEASPAPARMSRAIVVCALASLLTACGAAETPAPTLDPGAKEVATDLEVPWEMVVVGDCVLVSERDTGRIVEIGPDRRVREVVAVPDVRFGGEGGLLGLAVDPSGENLYAYSTAAGGNPGSSPKCNVRLWG